MYPSVAAACITNQGKQTHKLWNDHRAFASEFITDSGQLHAQILVMANVLASVLVWDDKGGSLAMNCITNASIHEPNVEHPILVRNQEAWIRNLDSGPLYSRLDGRLLSFSAL